jgi:hypothetical protein
MYYIALFNTTNRLLVSLYYTTHKVFTSHAKSSQADFFDYELPAAISYRQLPFLPTATGNSLMVLWETCYIAVAGQAAQETVSTDASHGVSRDRYRCVTSPHMRCVATVCARTRRNHFHSVVAWRMR